ncbi:MAG: AIM24 family protein [Planctomyces sp.]
MRSSERLTDSFFSGEGFINRFTGPGRLLYQTRVKPSGGLLRLLFSAVT